MDLEFLESKMHLKNQILIFNLTDDKQIPQRECIQSGNKVYFPSFSPLKPLQPHSPFIWFSWIQFVLP